MKTKKMSEDKAWRMLQVLLLAHTICSHSHAPNQFFNNRDDADVTNGMSVPVFMDWLEELDPIVSIDDTCVRTRLCSQLRLQYAASTSVQLKSSEAMSCVATLVCCCVG